MNMIIRRFNEKDAFNVAKMIANTLRTSNIRDYSGEFIENAVLRMQPENIIERAGWIHFYVAEENNEIIGCGGIGPYWNSETESSLFTIFVNPSFQGRGIGKKIVETLEKDEYFMRAKRIEVPSSITSQLFYKKMGYNYKDNIEIPDEEGLLRLEKFR